MKKLLLIILLGASLSPLYGANGADSTGDLSDEAVVNMKFDREFLLQKRDAFIKESGDLPVEEITVKGARKSNREMIIAETGIEPGAPLSSFDPHLFMNRMKKKNIFTDIEIKYRGTGTGAAIDITVEEKWTLIPIPVYSGNRHGSSYGLFIMESNFLGYGKFLFAGGTASTGSGTAMIGYIDPSIAGTKFRGNLFLTYRNEIYQNADVDYYLYREYRAEKRTARLDLGYTLTETLKFFISGGYEQGDTDTGYRDSLDAPDDQRSWISGVIARYERLAHYEYLYYGPKLEANIFRHTGIPGSSADYTTAGYRFDYSLRLIGYNRFSLSSTGFTGDRPEIFEETIGGKPGGRTLPASVITADSCANYTVSYEYILLRYRWGAVTLLTFWEHGFYKNNVTAEVPYYGPGAGIMVYMKRLALPAMGFNIARNLDTGRDEFSVNVGMSF